MQAPENSYAVILAGGGGTRLWPKSRKAYPKHLLTLFGDQSMLQKTYNRISPLIPKERILIITAKDYLEDIKNQLPELPEQNIILEPQPKNTALAMGVAAAYVHHRTPGAAIIYLAADHVITDEERFRQTVEGALQTALEGGYIVAVGVRPAFPHTGLGYIKVGKELQYLKDQNVYVFECDGFKEKPDLTTAQSFLASGDYLWNANIYCWSTQTIFNSFNKLAPETGKIIQEILNSIGTETESTVLESGYHQAENAQIDTAISEKADNIVVIPGDFGWNDVGDWKVVYDLKPKDNQGNVIATVGDYVNINSNNCLIAGGKRLIVTIGVEDLVVIDTPDALLICSKEHSQDVKKAVEKLKEEKKDQYL